MVSPAHNQTIVPDPTSFQAAAAAVSSFETQPETPAELPNDVNEEENAKEMEIQNNNEQNQ